MGKSAVALRVGSRGSPLALWQTHWIRDRLLESHRDLLAEVTIIKTRAERFPEQALAQIGVGVFTAELDEALLDGRIDVAVHSLKDLPSTLHDDIVIAAVPPRESPFDCFVSGDSRTLPELGDGDRIGTGSPRRRAQLLAAFPGLEVVPLRGNVETRLRKIADEGLAGTLLAHAGLRRLGKEDVVTEVLPVERLVPAVGQGALAVCVRRDDDDTRRRVAPLDDRTSHTRINAERAFLRRLRGGCQVPAGALASIEGDTLRLDGVLSSPDGATCLRETSSGPVAAGETLGERLAETLLDRGGEEVLERLRKGQQ